MPDGERDGGADYHAGLVDAKLENIQTTLNDLREELKADRAALDIRLHSYVNRIQSLELSRASASGFWSGSKWIGTAAVVAAWELIRVVGTHLLHGGNKT